MSQQYITLVKNLQGLMEVPSPPLRSHFVEEKDELLLIYYEIYYLFLQK